MAQSSYLLVEAVNLSTSVYDTEQLSIRRGASMYIHEMLDQIEKAEQLKGHSRLSRGGSFLLYEIKDLGQEQLASLTSEVELIYSQSSTPERPALVSFLSAVTQKQHEKESLSAVRTRLTNLLRAQQGKLISLDVQKTIVNIDPKLRQIWCSADHNRPATNYTQRRSIEADLVLSDYSYRRFDFGAKQKQKFINELIGEEQGRYLYAKDLHEIASMPEGFENQVSKADMVHQNDNVALVYFDGNNFSSVQKRLNEIELATFDHILHNLNRQFLINLVDSFANHQQMHDLVTTKKGEQKQKLKLEILIWGGDEILLVVPSWAALLTQATFYETFAQAQRESGDVEMDGLSFASSMVIAKSKTPISKLTAAAMAAVDFVKDFTRKENAMFPIVLESRDAANLRVGDYFTTLFSAGNSGENGASCEQPSPLQPASKNDLNELAKLKDYIVSEELTSPLRKALMTALNASNDSRTEALEALISGIKAATAIDIKSLLKLQPGDCTENSLTQHCILIAQLLRYLDVSDHLSDGS